jgi:transposase
LNPIEHAWAKLKETMYDVNPNIENLTGSDEIIQAAMIKTLEEA